LNILITSGSTSDFIDNVHYISNVSDGSLGSVLGEELSKMVNVEKIFYVCGKKTKFPWQHASSNDQKFFLDEWLDKIAIYPVEDIEQMEKTVSEIFSLFDIHAVFHMMSIVNYGNSKIHLLDNQRDAADFIEHVAKTFGLSVDVKTDVSQILPTAKEENRILSGFERLFIEQSPTKKILRLFREMKKDLKIVSSKMEYGAGYEKIIADSNASILKNNSDLVVAIDLFECQKESESIAYIVQPGEEVKRLSSTDSICSFLLDYILK